MAFPALSTYPLITPYEQSVNQDPVIRSAKEAGYVQTRPRFTRVPKQWHIEYGDLSDADKALLEAWEIAVMFGAASDTWTNPKDGQQYTVRQAAPIKYKFSASDSVWSAVFDLQQV